MIESPIARIRDLSVEYRLRTGFLGLKPTQTVKAVSQVSFDLRKGEILGLVGESGCGKSSLGKAIIRLIEPTGGHIEINGLDFLGLSGRQLRAHRSAVQMVFQDPYASLDPRMTVHDILAEPLHAHGKRSRKEISDKIHQTMNLVGLPTRHLRRYPHEFSGGQRQRVAIARALILDPLVVIADEPVSSLDVSVQAQILNLMRDIQRELQISMIFISHNLAVVKYLADRIAVMYLGKIVELGTRDQLFANPLHPYTQALLSAVPIPDPQKERARSHIALKGELPSPVNPPTGCAFHTRCPLVFDRCKAESPVLAGNGPSTVEAPARTVSCFAVKP